MAEILLFHHAHGLTSGVLAFAETLRRAGHIVHVPDLYEGRVFDDLDQGVAYAENLGFRAIIERGTAAAEALPNELVYAGFSLGVVPAQKLAQTRAGARGALLFSACIRPSEFGSAWPDGVPVQIHGMDADKYFAGEGDIDVARALVETAGAALFVYAGESHLFADASLPSYDDHAARVLTERVLAFLGGIG